MMKGHWRLQTRTLPEPPQETQSQDQNIRKLFPYSKHQGNKDKTAPQGEPCPWAEQWSELISNNEVVSNRVCLQNRLIHEK
jgi:hypothetical protein